MINRWFQAICILVALSSNALARPKENVYPVYRSLEDGKDGSDMVMSPQWRLMDKSEKSLEDIANVARSSYVPPTLAAAAPTPAKGAVDHMVDKDIRTPPKLKDTVKEKDSKNETATTEATTTKATVTPAVEKVEANGKFQLSGTPVPATGSFEGKAASSKKEEVVKGVAVPVIMDDEIESPPKKLQKLPNVAKPKDDKKKVVSTVKPAKETPTTTPSSGLSTWILLTDNREATTPSSATKKKVTTTTKKPVKLQQATNNLKITTSKPTKKPSASEKKNEPESALETMVKQKTAAAGVLVTSQKKKDQADKKVATIPPAIVIETTESSFPDWEVTESTQETTTKKKKTSSKKRKKNKNRTKKPAEKSGADQVLNDLVKQPKQPVGAQFYNFLSREIMPTVGLGLVGVLVTAGLAGLLGYNPFYGANIPVRRTYESQHGYYPNGNYYHYQSDYADSPSAKNEEVLFREVLSGMPEDSRYGMPPAEVSYPETTLHKSQEQAYNSAKNKEKKSEYSTKYSDPYDPSSKSDPATGYSDQYDTHYDSYTNQEQVGAKYPVYSGSESYVYPEKNTEKYKASAKYSEDGLIEKQPEALYRVSSDFSADSDSDASSPSATDSDQSWHRIGSPMDYSQASLVEPGPRRLDLDKMTDKLTQSQETHKRSKRSPEGLLARLVRRSNEVVNINLEDDKQNEIDFEEGAGGEEMVNSTEKAAPTETEPEPSSTTPLPLTEQPSLIDSFPNENSKPSTTETPPSLIDVLKRLAQFKLRLGLNFLKATNEAFGKYLEGVSQRVEDSMANDTSYPAIRYAWLGRENTDSSEMKVREKRYQRQIKDADVQDQVMDS